MSDYNCVYIVIDGKEEYEAVMKKAYDLGCKWIDGSDLYWIPDRIKHDYKCEIVFNCYNIENFIGWNFIGNTQKSAPSSRSIPIPYFFTFTNIEDFKEFIRTGKNWDT